MSDNIKIFIGDITKLSFDVIVNSANYSLLGGGGVDGAIHFAAGDQLYQECLALRKAEYPDGLPEGLAVITKGYNLPSKHVIHTVAPYCRDYNDDSWLNVLEACYINCLEIAEENSLTTIAFPSLGTGIFGCDKEKSANNAIKTVREYFHNNPNTSLKEVSFILFDESGLDIYKKIDS